MTLADLKPPPIEMRQLRYVATVADCGSITKAAARLGITQPSLSEALSRLEQDIGTKLLVRTKQGVILTEAGAALAEAGVQILAALDNVLCDVKRLSNQSRYAVSLGLPMTLTGLMAVPLAESISLEHPDIHVRIIEGTTAVLLEQMEKGMLDLAVCYEGPQFDKFSVRPLFEEELFLVAAWDNWEEGKVVNGMAQEPIPFERLKDLPLALPARQNHMAMMLDRLARARKFELTPLVELDSLSSLITLTTRASTYSVLSHAAVVNEVVQGTVVLVPFQRPVPTHTAYLLRARDRPVSSASLIVEAMIPSVLGEMIARHGLKARLLDMSSN